MRVTMRGASDAIMAPSTLDALTATISGAGHVGVRPELNRHCCAAVSAKELVEPDLRTCAQDCMTRAIAKLTLPLAVCRARHGRDARACPRKGTAALVETKRVPT